MVFAKLAALIILSTLPLSALSHPDLVLQIQALDAQIEAKPADADLLIKRGDLYRRHQEYAAAAMDLAAARKASPNNSILDFYDGLLLLERGDAQTAETHFKKYTDTHPEHSKAWMLRGKTSIELKQAENAAKYFARAIQTTQTPSPDLYRLQILSILAMGESEWNAAVNVTDEGLQHFGFEVSLLGLGVDIALATNQALKAEQYLRTLPDALRRLPQWDTRLSAVNCLTSPDPAASDQCLLKAKEILMAKVTTFMSVNVGY